jgi:hypothetical protein
VFVMGRTRFRGCRLSTQAAVEASRIRTVEARRSSNASGGDTQGLGDDLRQHDHGRAAEL